MFEDNSSVSSNIPSWNMKICEEYVFQDGREEIVVGKATALVGYYQLKYKYGEVRRT